MTDGQGRVYGSHNPRIVDDLLMPAILRTNANILTIQMAERTADFIRQHSGFA